MGYSYIMQRYLPYHKYVLVYFFAKFLNVINGFSQALTLKAPCIDEKDTNHFSRCTIKHIKSSYLCKEHQDNCIVSYEDQIQQAIGLQLFIMIRKITGITDPSIQFLLRIFPLHIDIHCACRQICTGIDALLCMQSVFYPFCAI